MPETNRCNIDAFWIDPRKYTSYSIPWANFEEIEIQAILKLLFEKQGFTVHWRHSEDRIHEEGADLVCIGKSKKIAIAVKKKPLKKDLYQLLELSNFDSDEKIYVYSGEAAVAFENDKKKYSNINWWTYVDLQRNILAQMFEMGFDLVSDNMTFTFEYLRLFRKIRTFVVESETSKEAHIVQSYQKPKLMALLWGMKDRISVLNKSCCLMQAIFESKALPEDMSTDKILSLFSVGVNFLLRDSLQQFSLDFDVILSEYRQLLLENYYRTRDRSNWKIFQNLMPFDFTHIFQPGAVIEKYRQLEKEAELFKDIPPNADYLEALLPQEITKSKIRLVGNFFRDVEKILDDVFDLVNNK